MKDWFRIKKYPHIDDQLSYSDKKKVSLYVKNEEAVANHIFLPFIHRTSKVRKFRKEIAHDGTRSILRKPSVKIRKLYYSAHFDANVYSYYARTLSRNYESLLKNLNLEDSVSAYRQVKLNKNEKHSRSKCNIDFANDVFNFILSRKGINLTAITFDIKSFFDNLDHKILKENWIKVLVKSDLSSDKERLPDHHYNVYRNITKFSYVDEDELFFKYKQKIVVKISSGTRNKLINKKKYLKNQNAIAFCLKNEIANIRSAGLIKSNKYIWDKGEKKELRSKGIPQGSPISAVLANIYLIDFDVALNNLARKFSGIYQRYSDDMVIICDVSREGEVIEQVKKEIEKVRLEIQDTKTQVFEFQYDTDKERHVCYEKNLNTKKYSFNNNFEYLGFQFDGYHTLLKNSSLSGYYRKLKRAISKAKYRSNHTTTSTKGEIFKSRLYKKFTFLGAKRRRLYLREKNNPSVFRKTTKHDWGNFLTYAYKADSILPNSKIHKQTKGHWKIFHREITSVFENL